MKNYRKRLLQNNKTIKITDFGAGSRVFSSKERKVSSMAKKVGMSSKRVKLLNRLVRYLNIENALELGTSLGIGTAALAIKNDVQIITLEGCPETTKVAQENFDAFELNNIELKIGEFDALLEREIGEREENREKREGNKEIPNSKFQIPNPKSHPEISGTNPELTNPKSRISNPQLTNHKSRITNPKQQTFDLIFFDGNHQKEATLSYFEKLLPLANNNSVFIFDDIHWSNGMEAAWKEISAHPRVKVSIDTFQWGLVFFRKEQEKQHFVIRL